MPKCNQCKGEGTIECGKCKGSGKLGGSDSKNKKDNKQKCPNCDGSGEVKCSTCNGTGYTQKNF